MYYYADGKDKKGNRLMTSYGKELQAQKYRPDAKITTGEKYLNITEDGVATIGGEGDLLLRTLMIRPDEGSSPGGKFVVYGRVANKWQKTPFSYPNYAAANAAVKSALITMYDACAVIESDLENPFELNDEAV